MTFYLPELAEKIKSLKISNVEAERFLAIFSRCKQAELKTIVELIREQPKLLEYFYDNFKKKKECLTKNDPIAWESILKEEADFLKTLGP